MGFSRGFTSSRMFLYLGLLLIVLAVVTLPTKIPLQAQPMDVDYYTVGWLFAPIIGVWGLASVVLGLVGISAPKSRITTYLSVILVVVTVGLAYASYLAAVFGTGIIRSVGQGEPFWWLYFGLVLAPSALIYASAFKFFKAKEKTEILVNKKVKTAALVVLPAVPLSYTTIFLLLLQVL